MFAITAVICLQRAGVLTGSLFLTTQKHGPFWDRRQPEVQLVVTRRYFSGIRHRFFAETASYPQRLFS